MIFSSYKITSLQYDWENREQLKYFKNVCCVKTNHSKDQDIRASHKTTSQLLVFTDFLV